jgi:hypothetical protein
MTLVGINGINLRDGKASNKTIPFFFYTNQKTQIVSANENVSAFHYRLDIRGQDEI